MRTGRSPREFAAAESLREARAYQRALRDLDRRLGASNEALIRSSDALLAILDGTDVDSGTAAEIGFAGALEIRRLDCASIRAARATTRASP